MTAEAKEQLYTFELLAGMVLLLSLISCTKQRPAADSSEKGGDVSSGGSSVSSAEREKGDIPDRQEGAAEGSYPCDSVFPQHEPYGEGIGAMPGRVVWVYDTDSVLWDGDGFW